MLNRSQQQFLLELARNSISYYLANLREPHMIEPEDTELKEKRGVFVTLTIDGNLRGCIGHINAVQPLYLDVIENAINAAFDDPRFDQLAKSELERIKIEISVLSKPVKLDYENPDDLISKLNGQGVIIKRGSRQATYLPQVWEDLRDKKMFLSSLCMKAGLPADSWEKDDLEVQTYTVEKFEEEN